MNTDLNVYEVADYKGRKMFQEFCNTQNWCKMITVGQPKDVWDVAYFSGGTKIIGEIKVREKHSKQYPDWDYEFTKHNNLLDVYYKTKSKKRNQNKKIEIQYINFFTDDEIKIWTTTNLHNEQQPKLKDRIKSKVENKGNVDKWIYGCSIQNEAFRGSITPIQYGHIVEDDNEDDGLPF